MAGIMGDRLILANKEQANQSLNRQREINSTKFTTFTSNGTNEIIEKVRNLPKLRK